ncbi:glucuronate isomerase [Thermotoga sp. KOL6]|uniref:glucuronate isomerase n=1 Tax=Thermotoga sp. KOL6 TaxID=126741 RepID=UPI000C78347D|nr:glucuronate isomerase [Thermotoga sp. KOL6]PLV58674.1 glucuronate isomerase [Thermotoga sp. KOL6]
MFLGEKYLLTNKAAEKLFNEVKELPIVDPHNHLSAKDIVENKPWNDIWEVEGATDHYVWELMRRCGVSEEYITGSMDDKEKWFALAKVLPKFVGNPTYEWIHLDLWRRFNIKKVISEETAEEIWEETKKLLPSMTPQKLLKDMGVEILCTTDDPIDTLEYHRKAQEVVEDVKILPTWRPDKAMNLEKEDWKAYLERLGERYGEDTSNLEGFLSALWKSHEHFKAHGCVASDHALLEPLIHYVERKRAEGIHRKAFKGEKLSQEEINDYKAFMMVQFGKMNQEMNWVTQLHIGALRDYRKKLFRTLGPDSGGDISTNFLRIAEGLEYFLNEFDGKLKIVLYVLDPTHLPTIATISRAFPNVFVGAPWWFNDSPFGMEVHLKYLASVDLLYNLAGMVTDSRKLLSFGSRTEVFRRVLSNVVGEMVERGQVPIREAKSLVKHVCYDGPKTLFF